MNLSFLFDGLYYGITMIIVFAVLDYAFYHLFKLKPLVFDVFANDFDKYRWLLDSMKVCYTVKSYKETSEIHTKTNCITFDTKGNIINEDKWPKENR